MVRRLPPQQRAADDGPRGERAVGAAGDALEALDLSWCRGVSDQPLGALVDRCAALRKLTIWGCSQLTPLFFNGHKNDALEVVGRGPGQ